MTNVNWERAARATGIVFVVLFVVAYIIYGDQPAAGASSDDLTSFYQEDRGRVLTSSVIFSVGILFFLWFVAAVASTLREAGLGGWGAATLVAGATAAAGFFGLITLGAGIAYSTYAEQNLTVLNDIVWAMVVMLSWPAALAILVATMGLWRGRLLATWYGWFGLAATIVVLLGGTTWARDGFWAPDGAWSRFVAPIAAMLWLAVTSWLLYARAPARERAPETAAARPM